MKLTWQQRYALVGIRNAPEGVEFDPEQVDYLAGLGLVHILKCSDGNYASITQKGLKALAHP